MREREREKWTRNEERKRGSGYEFILRKMRFEREGERKRMGGEIEEQQHYSTTTTTTKGFVCIVFILNVCLC